MTVIEAVLKKINEFGLKYQTPPDWHGAKVVVLESIGTLFLHTEGENRSVFFSNMLREGIFQPNDKLLSAINEYNAKSSVTKMFWDDGSLYITAFMLFESPEQAENAVSLIISDMIDEDKLEVTDKLYEALN